MSAAPPPHDPPGDAPPWRGAELFARPGVRVTLGQEERGELTRWSRQAQEQAQDPLGPRQHDPLAPGSPETRRERFPALARRAEAIADTLEDGAGAVLLRGLPPSTSDGEAAALLWALANLLGTPLSQDTSGRRLLSVRDEGHAPGDPRFRGPHSSLPLRFHTDRCDWIGFLCVRAAARGGETHLLHARALRDALRAAAPALARVLERDSLPYLRHTIDGANPRPFTRVPVFTETGGRFAASLLRVLVDRADRDPRAPSLTDAQRQALDALEEAAEDPALYARFRLEPGELLLVNNWLLFHRRTGFEDEGPQGDRRLLHRVWLSSPRSRALDPRYADHFGATAAGALRGGIRPVGPPRRPHGPPGERPVR